MDTSTMFPKRALLALVLAFAAGTVGASAAGGGVAKS